MLQDASPSAGTRLLDIYHRLIRCYGPQHWWPADEPFEVMVGAILTQSAAWSNVEKAISNLKAAGVLNPGALRAASLRELACLVYPSGYYNAKARKVKALVEYIGERYGDDLAGLFTHDLHMLREELLAVHGVGEETADSILLYAAGKPVFVIDAYTKRIFARLGLCSEGETYRTVQDLFMDALPHEPQLFNEYHALIVQHGKDVCRKRPLCAQCCILNVCPYGQDRVFHDEP